METVELQIKGSLAGKRLDLAMVDAVKGLSRRRAKSLIDEGVVFVNDRKIRIASRQLEFGETLVFRYNPAPKKKKKPVQITEREVLFHDSGVIAINKPVGVPVQATKKGDRFHIVPIVQKYFQEKGASFPELTLVHRLDKETSGVLLLAESKKIADALMDQFRDKSITKNYQAICYGKAQDEFEVKCKLSSINPKNGTVKVSQKSGKDSQTFFQKKEFFKSEGLSLVDCRPITGRSHQIRVHLAKSKIPILGDKVYGDISKDLSSEVAELASEHHYLHARSLRFTVPGKEKVIGVKAPYPESWQNLLALLRA